MTAAIITVGVIMGISAGVAFAAPAIVFHRVRKARIARLTKATETI